MDSKIISHMSHGLGDSGGDTHPGNIARDSRNGPKHATAKPVMVHDGMRTRSAAGEAYSGQHKSALDALTGATVPTGSGMASAPGWGNGSVRSGDPTAHAPASKVLKPVAITPGHRSRTSKMDHEQLAELGRAILAQAVSNK